MADQIIKEVTMIMTCSVIVERGPHPGTVIVVDPRDQNKGKRYSVAWLKAVLAAAEELGMMKGA